MMRHLCLLPLLLLLLHAEAAARPLHEATARHAVPGISDFGWKFLQWGMSPHQAAGAFRVAGRAFGGTPRPAMDLLAGFDEAWRPLEIPAAAMSPENRGLIVQTDFQDALLLFHDQRLFGVYITATTPRHIQDRLFQAMQRRYPEGRSLSRGPGRSRFQHFAGNRRIVWEGRPTGFTLAFYDPARMPATSATMADSRPRPAPQAVQQATGPLSTWIEPRTGVEFVHLAGGCFTRRSPREQAAQEICLPDFWITRHEVSEGQFAVFAAAAAPFASASPQPELLQDDLPMAALPRLDALDFTDWLDREHPGRDFALPTAAQWEFAARAGLQGSAPWPSFAAACEWGNFADQNATQSATEDVFPCEDGHADRAPVGSYKPNAWGLHDLLGNVWEWCFPSRYDLETAFTACGGSHRSGPQSTGFFSRLQQPPETPREDLGLRLVMEMTHAAPGPDTAPTRPLASPQPLPQPVGEPLEQSAPQDTRVRPAIEDLM